MRKFLTGLIIAAALAALAVVGINYILTDDDLAGCTAPGVSEACPKSDVIVAVSGGDTAARARKAAQLYLDGWASKIIYSGDSADPMAVSNAAEMKKIAISMKVPARNILVEEKSTNTAENATYTMKLLDEMDARKVILVSSPYHTRRVKLNFIKASDTDTMRFMTATADDEAWHKWYLKASGWQIAVNELAGLAAVSATTK